MSSRSSRISLRPAAGPETVQMFTQLRRGPGLQFFQKAFGLQVKIVQLFTQLLFHTLRAMLLLRLLDVEFYQRTCQPLLRAFSRFYPRRSVTTQVLQRAAMCFAYYMMLVQKLGM